MEKYGISLTNADGPMKSFGDVVKNLRSSLGGLSEAEQVAAATTIFGKESFAGMLAIVNASEADFNKLTDAVYNCDGAAKQMAETKLDNLNGSITLAQSAFTGRTWRIVIADPYRGHKEIYGNSKCSDRLCKGKSAGGKNYCQGCGCISRVKGRRTCSKTRIFRSTRGCIQITKSL